jgi:hypothetical protein
VVIVLGALGGCQTRLALLGSTVIVEERIAEHRQVIGDLDDHAVIGHRVQAEDGLGRQVGRQGHLAGAGGR